MSAPLLTIRGITVRTLRGVDLDLDAGSIAVVAGPSGAGKSTLLDALLGVLPANGTILLDGVPADVPARRRSLAWVGQDAGATLQPRWSALRCVADPMHVAGVDEVAAEVRARAALAEVGLDAEVAAALPRRLSGGQQQRVAIARALCQGARILVLDEPSSALSPEATVALGGLLRSICGESRAALVVSHDPTLAVAADARVHHLEGGRIVRVEPAARWAANEAARWQECS